MLRSKGLSIHAILQYRPNTARLPSLDADERTAVCPYGHVHRQLSAFAARLNRIDISRIAADMAT